MFEVVYYEERKTVRVYVPVPVFFSKKGSLPVVPVQVMKLAGYSVSLARYLFGQQGIRENQYPVHPLSQGYTQLTNPLRLVPYRYII